MIEDAAFTFFNHFYLKTLSNALLINKCIGNFIKLMFLYKISAKCMHAHVIWQLAQGCNYFATFHCTKMNMDFDVANFAAIAYFFACVLLLRNWKWRKFCET